MQPQRVKQQAARISRPQCPVSVEGLTGRDLDVIRRIYAGAANAEIASALFLTEGTVKNYVSSLYAKLGVRHRAEAVKLAAERRLI
ncbi:helix-turn-helix transcriptional regulator [Paenibacillus filicis]|uniref:Helix-turn-helix transcriptional regulator n=1 Tax=Paenibacillus gyeongsangnamensis TaxID=3388067 RepID=A0ABT4QHQ3_9BACL|nr:helix-turn-helix transcriptional regulator [Paenibacillus filicis]MCZ8516398.1 helix-turn-helix transcriptional regulator [Paenibacillus filicis]